MGIFKFKSTPRGAKPTRDDLAKLIRGGIAGTAMKPIPGLTEEDIQSLVDYVIYLSWRGEVERLQIDMAVLDGIIEDGERVIDSDLGQRLDSDPAYHEFLEALAEIEKDGLSDEQKEELELYKRLKSDPAYLENLEALAEKEKDGLSDEQKEELKLYKRLEEELKLYERFLEDWEYIDEQAEGIGNKWLQAERKVIEVPDPPTGFPLAESYTDVIAIRSSENATEFDASVQRGQELFVGKIATCSKCHGDKGLGDGQTTDYDDWTKDWTARVGLKPEDRESLIPLLARGALAPRNAIPRNFAEGIFRGGSNSKDLYRRIMQGIDGTPMPAATFVEGQFEQDDVWHIINFIRSLQTAEADPITDQAAKPAA
jgi:mono/diheme cytochrome c family protein